MYRALYIGGATMDITPKAEWKPNLAKFQGKSWAKRGQMYPDLWMFMMKFDHHESWHIIFFCVLYITYTPWRWTAGTCAKKWRFLVGWFRSFSFLEHGWFSCRVPAGLTPKQLPKGWWMKPNVWKSQARNFRWSKKNHKRIMKLAKLPSRERSHIPPKKLAFWVDDFPNFPFGGGFVSIPWKVPIFWGSNNANPWWFWGTSPIIVHCLGW